MTHTVFIKWKFSLCELEDDTSGLLTSLNLRGVF